MKLISEFNRRVGEFVCLFYLAVFAIIIYDVVLRYFFDAPTVWGLELVIALAGIQYVLGGAQAIRDDAHVRIDVIYLLFSPRTRRNLDILSSVLVIIFLSIVCYYGFLQAQTSWLRDETSGAGWNSHAPMYMKIAIPVGASLMLLQSIVQLIKALTEEPSDVG